MAALRPSGCLQPVGHFHIGRSHSDRKLWETAAQQGGQPWNDHIFGGKMAPVDEGHVAVFGVQKHVVLQIGGDQRLCPLLTGFLQQASAGAAADGHTGDGAWPGVVAQALAAQPFLT